MAPGESPVTGLLQALARGDAEALNQLTPLIYGELHRIAGAYLRRERRDHTLRPTELVSEAFVRLARGQHPAYADRIQFFAVAARHMRRILVDHARQRSAGKRAGNEQPITLEEGAIAVESPENLIQLDEGLEKLAQADPRKAKAVELHYFGGLSHREIAAALSVHENTVARDLRLGEAWLRRHLDAAN